MGEGFETGSGLWYVSSCWNLLPNNLKTRFVGLSPPGFVLEFRTLRPQTKTVFVTTLSVAMRGAPFSSWLLVFTALEVGQFRRNASECSRRTYIISFVCNRRPLGGRLS